MISFQPINVVKFIKEVNFIYFYIFGKEKSNLLIYVYDMLFIVTAPGPILNLDVSITDKNSIQVTFDPPDQPNGVIQSYTVQYSGTAEVCIKHYHRKETTLQS